MLSQILDWDFRYVTVNVISGTYMTVMFRCGGYCNIRYWTGLEFSDTKVNLILCTGLGFSPFGNFFY